MTPNDPSKPLPLRGPDLPDEPDGQSPGPDRVSRSAPAANPALVRTRSLLGRLGSPYTALRTAREEARLSLSDLSDRLAVRPAFLEAIETGNLAVLPGSSYAGSLINMYATSLGLDGESLVEAAFPVAAPVTVPSAPMTVFQAPDAAPSAPAPPAPRRIIPGARLLARRPSFTSGAPPPAPAGSGPVVTVDAPYAGDPVPAQVRRGDRAAEASAKPMQWVPGPSTLAVPERPSVTAAPVGTAVKALRWAALVLFVAAVLAALVLIAIVLVRSFEPQTPLGMLLPWLPLLT